MTELPIRTERRGAVLEVTLDRPKANAIDLITSRHMGEIFGQFRDDPDLRVALLTAAGDKFFCPGWDLKAAADGDAVDGDYGIGGFGGLQEPAGRWHDLGAAKGLGRGVTHHDDLVTPGQPGNARRRRDRNQFAIQRAFDRFAAIVKGLDRHAKAGSLNLAAMDRADRVRV